MRYLVKFEKKDMMIFISHLDTQRVFHRAMKQLGLKLKYSKGFNPHPKLSFAQPLSIGHSSIAEYMEFETVDAFPRVAALKDLFNGIMPRGIKVLEVRTLQEGTKSIASMVAAVKYMIEIPFFFSYMEATMNFFGAGAIMAEKRQKKTGKMETINIRPQIVSLKPLMVNNNNNIVLLSTLYANLNPEIMLRSFYKSSVKAYDRGAIKIERTSLLCWRGEELVPLESVI